MMTRRNARWLWTLPLLVLSACAGGSSPAGNSPPPPPPPPPPPAGGADVLTYHNDNSRSGLNPLETELTPVSVSSASFGKLALLATDGRVDAQPLVVSGLSIAGTAHDVVFAASEHDTVYAWDLESGTKLWSTSLLGNGETPSDPRSCGQVAPEIGVTSTPVIDRHAGSHGTIWLVAMSKSAGGSYFQRLHALDITTGAEQGGSPVSITAQYPGTGANSSNGQVRFDPAQYKERSALLLQGGTIYTSWASHCDIDPYTGWLIAYDGATLHQTGVLNTEPNGSEGAFWNSGGGPAADAAGNLYLMSGNGSFETTLDGSGFPDQQDYGNAVTRITTGSTLRVADYFTMSDTVAESNADEDLGSSGLLLLPDQVDISGATRHLLVASGKDARIYLLDRDNLGKFIPGPLTNNGWQVLYGILGGGEFGSPAWFNGTVYIGAVGDYMRGFAMSHALIDITSFSQTSIAFGYPGTTPSVSAGGAANGIVWAVENSNPAVLHAYDAGNLAHELYNSNQAAGQRDQFGAGNKFITPTIADGRVLVGTPTGVALFGLLH